MNDTARFAVRRLELTAVLEQTFDAEPGRIWAILTDPALVPRWWGPADLETCVDVMEPRPGGRWRFLQREKNGSLHAFSGTYTELDPPRLLVRTFNYEPLGPGHEVEETLQLQPDGPGRTRLTSSSRFRSFADLDGMIDGDMEAGALESYERLEGLLKQG